MMQFLKYYPLLFLFLLFISFNQTAAQCYWEQKANFGGSARVGATMFNIDKQVYLGFGFDGSQKKDLWEYDIVTNP